MCRGRILPNELVSMAENLHMTYLNALTSHSKSSESHQRYCQRNGVMTTEKIKQHQQRIDNQLQLLDGIRADIGKLNQQLTLK